MSKALFFRKCSNEEEYFKLANTCSEFGNVLDFEIVVTIILKPNEYIDFKNNFLKDNENLKKITNKLYMDENDKVYCAFVTDGSYNGFLVYTAGYDYARYVAYHYEEKKYLKGE